MEPTFILRDLVNRARASFGFDIEAELYLAECLVINVHKMKVFDEVIAVATELKYKDEMSAHAKRLIEARKKARVADRAFLYQTKIF